MKKALLFLSIGFLLTVFSSSASALTVSETGDAATLVNAILGTGITVSNVTYNGGSNASGTFTGGENSIGMNSGAILTTGSAKDAEGPNSSPAMTTINGLGGDSDLNTLVPSFATYDATVLEFDFTIADGSAGGDLFFNFAFASDEYNEFSNSQFNDVFGFYLDGVNLALVPGTGEPITINTINGGNPVGTNASNPDLFNNNESGLYDIEYDGFTDILTAQALGLDAGSHHIKIAIADGGDNSLDSAIFIQGGTFSNEPNNPVPEPTTVILLGAGVLGLAGASRKRKKA